MELATLNTIQAIIVIIQALYLWFHRKSTKSSTAVIELSLNVSALALTTYIIFIYDDHEVLQLLIFVLQFIMLPINWRDLKLTEDLEAK